MPAVVDFLVPIRDDGAAAQVNLREPNPQGGPLDVRDLVCRPPVAVRDALGVALAHVGDRRLGVLDREGEQARVGGIAPVADAEQRTDPTAAFVPLSLKPPGLPAGSLRPSAKPAPHGRFRRENRCTTGNHDACTRHA